MTPPRGSVQGGHFPTRGNAFQYSPTPQPQRYNAYNDVNSYDYSPHYSNVNSEQANLENQTPADIERERSAFEDAFDKAFDQEVDNAVNAAANDVRPSSTFDTNYFTTVPEVIDTSRVGVAAAGATAEYAARYGNNNNGTSDHQSQYSMDPPDDTSYAGSNNLKNPF
jgi:hypothetical protein